MSDQVSDTMKKFAAAELQEERQAKMQAVRQERVEVRPGSAADLIFNRVREASNFHSSWEDACMLLRNLVSDGQDPREQGRVSQIRELVIQLSRTLCECHARLGHIFAEHVDEIAEQPELELPRYYGGRHFLDTARRSGIDVGEQKPMCQPLDRREGDTVYVDASEQVGLTDEGRKEIEKKRLSRRLNAVEGLLSDLYWQARRVSDFGSKFIGHLGDALEAAGHKENIVDSTFFQDDMTQMKDSLSVLGKIVDLVEQGPTKPQLQRKSAMVTPEKIRAADVDTSEQGEKKDNVLINPDYLAQLEQMSHDLIELMWASDMLVVYIPKFIVKTQSIISEKTIDHLENLWQDLEGVSKRIHGCSYGPDIREQMARFINQKEKDHKYLQGMGVETHRVPTVRQIKNSLKGSTPETDKRLDQIGDRLDVAKSLVTPAVTDYGRRPRGPHEIGIIVEGENGSGKSTLVSVLTKLIARCATSGVGILDVDATTALDVKRFKGESRTLEDLFGFGFWNKVIVTQRDLQDRSMDPQPVEVLPAELTIDMMKEHRMIDVLNSDVQEILLDTVVDEAMLREFCEELDTSCREYPETGRDNDKRRRFVIHSASTMYVFHYDPYSQSVKLCAAKRVFGVGEQSEVESTKFFCPARLRDLREVFTLITRNEIGNAEELREHLVSHGRQSILDEQLETMGQETSPEIPDEFIVPRPRVGQNRVIRIDEQVLRELVKMVDTVREDNTKDGVLMATGVLFESKHKVDSFDVKLDSIQGTQMGGNYEVGAIGLPPAEPGKGSFGVDGEVTQ